MAQTSRRALQILSLAALAAAQLATATASEFEPASSDRFLSTNEEEIRRARESPDGLAVSDPRATFDYVLARLPPRVKVYPTENYYYFSFLHGGVAYRGNIRLDAMDREQGVVHFAYFRSQTPWMGRSAVTHLVLGRTQGVTVEKLNTFHYRVESENASTIFELNDLSNVVPSPSALLPGEQYLGPVFDESGVRFFLLFDPRAKVFYYLLDASEPVGDRFAPASASGRIEVGLRTGFAFYRDHRAPRRILIGVYAENIRLNNYFDGPFDQLPDNFIDGDSLRQAILAVSPSLAGRIDRLGHIVGQDARFMIAPYIRYEDIADLSRIDDCAVANTARPKAYAACFAHGTIDASQ